MVFLYGTMHWATGARLVVAVVDFWVAIKGNGLNVAITDRLEKSWPYKTVIREKIAHVIKANFIFAKKCSKLIVNLY